MRDDLKEKIKLSYNKDIMFFFIITFFILKKYLVIVCDNILQTNSILINICYALFAILTIIKIIISRIEKEEIILIILSFLLYFITKDKSLLIYMSIAIAAKDIEFRKIVKYYFVVNLGLFLAVAISVAVGILPDVGAISYRAGTDKIRSDFGFLNPNIPFLNLLPVFAGYMYLRFDKYTIYDRVLLLLSTIYIYMETDSRTGFLSIILGMLFLELIKRIDIKKYVSIQYIIVLGPIIMSAVSIVIGTILSGNYELNKLLSYRPIYWNEYLGKITLWGGNYTEKLNLIPLDNSYIYLLALSGIVIYITIMYILCKSIKIAIYLENKGFIVATYTFLIYALSENVLYDRPLNFPIVLSFIYFIEYIKNLNILEKYKMRK